MLSPHAAGPATRLGTIRDVSGATVRAVLEGMASGLRFVGGRGYRVGQPGSFVRVPIGYTDLFGVVSQVGATAVPPNRQVTDEPDERWLTVQLIGEAGPEHGFERGLSQYPTVGDSVHLVTQSDLLRLYGAGIDLSLVRLGQLASSTEIPAYIDLNRLVARHCAVVGSTGAGKSTAVAQLIRGITHSPACQSSRVLVMDIHGEYAKAFGDVARVFSVTPDAASGALPLAVPYWALEFDELMSISFGSFSSDADRGAVADRVRALKAESIARAPRRGIVPATLNVDSPVPFSLHRLWYELYLLVAATHLRTGNQGLDSVAFELNSRGEPVDKGSARAVRPPRVLPQDTSAAASPKVYLSQSPLNIRRPIEALGSRLRDMRYSFLFEPGPWVATDDGAVAKDLDVLLAGWLGGPGRVTILDLSGVPRDILGDLIGAILRIVYDSLFWSRNLSEGGRERPLLLVLEEAHAYVGADSRTGAARMVRRIVREGRKYGIGAAIVSQRPSELDPTVLSQCGSLISLRLTNSLDRAQVSAAAPDNLEGLFSLLPVLRTGEALIVGEAVRVPTRVVIDPPPRGLMPESDDPSVVELALPGGWNRRREPEDYAAVLERWRAQNPRAVPGPPSERTGQ